MLKRISFLLVAIVSLTVLTTAVACGDDDDDDVEAGNTDDSGDASANGAQAIALSIREIDTAGFHDTEDSIAGGEIPATARSTALQIEALIRLTAWPEALEDQALELADTLNEAAAAYDQGDAEAALPHAEAVHDGQHDFSAEVYVYLGEEAGVTELTGGHGDEGSEGEDGGSKGSHDEGEEAKETATQGADHE
jgi:hypothetical protein